MKYLICSVLILALSACGGDEPATDVADSGSSDTAVQSDVAEDTNSSVDTLNDTLEPVDTAQPDTTPPPDPGPPADPMVCTGKTQGQLQPFGGACCYTAADNQWNPDCVWYSDTYNEGACLDAQCDSNFCTGSRYCTKGCTFQSDALDNHTGENKPDGIMDDAILDDCALAADGPHGAEFHCVNLSAPFKKVYGVCRPGTTFKECESNKDCEVPGEVCNVLYVLGEYESRCMAALKNGGELADACNSDPNDGPLTPCKGPFCFGFGCTEFCDGDASCATDTCEDGKCSKTGAECSISGQCSALYCKNIKPYSNADYTDDACYPKECMHVGDCGDPDWFCRPYWNGADKVEDVALAPSCRKKAEGTASYGEPCGLAGDGTGLPECAWYYGCIDNHCSGPCGEDTDCGDGESCLLGATWNIDVDDDDEGDATVNVDTCQVWPHSGDLTDCVTDADCTDGEHCQYRVKGQDTELGRLWLVEFKCRTNYEEQAEFGEACGSDNGKQCGSNLCLVPSAVTDAKTLCTKTCKSKSDCPETVQYDGMNWKTTCKNYTVNSNQTDDPTQTVYLGYCWYTSPIASVEPCDAQMNCGGNLEYCRAQPIAGNPDEPVTVDHLCLDFSQGLDTIPTKHVGAPCSSWTECRGRTCLPDGQGGGYCSELCTDDADCQNPDGLAGLKCTEHILVPRTNPEHSGKTNRCVLAETCLSCTDNNSCGGDYICLNVGGIGPTLTDMRCGALCDPEVGCEDAAHNCIEKINQEGNTTGEFACMPSNCQ